MIAQLEHTRASRAGTASEVHNDLAYTRASRVLHGLHGVVSIAACIRCMSVVRSRSKKTACYRVQAEWNARTRETKNSPNRTHRRA